MVSQLSLSMKTFALLKMMMVKCLFILGQWFLGRLIFSWTMELYDIWFQYFKVVALSARSFLVACKEVKCVLLFMIDYMVIN